MSESERKIRWKDGQPCLHPKCGFRDVRCPGCGRTKMAGVVYEDDPMEEAKKYVNAPEVYDVRMTMEEMLQIIAMVQSYILALPPDRPTPMVIFGVARRIEDRLPEVPGVIKDEITKGWIQIMEREGR